MSNHSCISWKTNAKDGVGVVHLERTVEIHKMELVEVNESERKDRRNTYLDSAVRELGNDIPAEAVATSKREDLDREQWTVGITLVVDPEEHHQDRVRMQERIEELEKEKRELERKLESIQDIADGR